MKTSVNKAVETLFLNEICPWDLYCETMAHTDFMMGRHEVPTVKTYFYRTAPFGGSYALFGGLTEFLMKVKNFDFTKAAKSMSTRGYNVEFIEYLKKRDSKASLQVKIHSLKEGDLIFPHEPVLIISGPLMDVRFVEGMINVINRGSLFLTKWRRVVEAANPNPVFEFSRRRAQNDLSTALYAQMAGVAGTSNTELNEHIDVTLVGTMGHEFIQSIGNEFEAFDKYLEFNPGKPVLLIDTIDPLNSGMPNAIKAFKKHEQSIKDAGAWERCGIRNDSGDLVYLTIKEIMMLSAAGLDNVGITQTNDLDEYTINSMKAQIVESCGMTLAQHILKRVSWACGTKPGNAYDCPAFGGVAKLSVVNGDPSMKLTLKNPEKASIPGDIRSKLIYNKKNGEIVACLTHLVYEDNDVKNPESETYKAGDLSIGYHKDDKTRFLMFSVKNHIFENRQELTYDWEQGFVQEQTLQIIKERVEKSMAKLSWYHKRQLNPDEVKVCLSSGLFNLRFQMKDRKKLIGDFEWRNVSA